MKLLSTAHSYLTKPALKAFKVTFGLFKGAKESYSHSKKVHDTIVQLNKLSTKDLRDIGISRGEIYDVAISCDYNRRGQM